MGMVVSKVGAVVAGFLMIFAVGVVVSDSGGDGCWVGGYFCGGVVVGFGLGFL